MARVIKPKEVTDAVLISAGTSIPEPDTAGGDPAVYASGTTYATGARVTVVSAHKIYESLADGNVGNNPPDDVLLDEPKWVEIGYTNKWRAFDPYVNTASSGANAITFCLDATRTSSVALFNVSGASVSFVLKNADGTTLASETISLGSRTTLGWLDYFFGEFEYIDKVLWTYPIGFGTKLYVTVNAPSGTASVGLIRHGIIRNIGMTAQEVSMGIVDFSVKVEDTDYGYVYLRQGAYHDLIDVNLYIPTESTTSTDRLLKSLRALGCVWLLENEEFSESTDPMLFLYGYVKDYGVVIKNKHSGSYDECRLQLESLI